MNKNLKRSLLVLEINEIPWRVIDKFRNHLLFPNINRFFNEAATYTTLIEENKKSQDETKIVKGLSKDGQNVFIDSGELSPWVTWPTVHCGILSSDHCIRFLGQDINTFKGKSIWEEFLDKGYSIGICGSLQSWPPKDPGKGGFYIPDTFAHDEHCVPSYIEPFQRFNLNQVQRNGLVIRQRELFTNELFNLMCALPKLGITFKTFCRCFSQLVLECLNKAYVKRRPVFQCILFWDIFKSLYNVENPPAFSTFFTNHFASLIHRYWHSIFPEDFKDFKVNNKKDHYATVLFGLKILDEIIGDAINIIRRNPDITLVFLTSMGQDAIRYTSFEGYSAELEDISKLFTNIGISSEEYIPLLAMVPQLSVKIRDKETMKKIAGLLNSCYSKSGKQLFTTEEAGNTLSITIHTPPKEDILSGKFNLRRNGKYENFNWNETGIVMHKLDIATGYHIPEGVMAVVGKGINTNDSRKIIKATEVKSSLLKLAFSS